MGKINIINGGEASDEEVDLFFKGQGVNPGAPLKATDIQPLAKRKGTLTNKDLIPQELKEGKAASATEVVDQFMAVSDQNMDMIGECVKILRAYGAHDNQINAMLNSPLVSAAKGTSTYTQRAALNSFWSQAIGRMGEAGMRYRRNLVTQGSVRDWLNLFGNGPAQFIAQFSLPVGCGAPVKKAVQHLRPKD